MQTQRNKKNRPLMQMKKRAREKGGGHRDRTAPKALQELEQNNGKEQLQSHDFQ